MNRRVLIGGGIAVAVLLLLGLVVSNIQNIINWLGGAIDFILNPQARIQTVILCSQSDGCRLLHPILFGIIFVLVIVTGFAYTTLLERKLIAWFQQRTGPNRVGPGGFMQPAADAVKLIFKEDIIPDKVDKFVYYLAPMMKVVPVLIVLAVVPLGPDIIIPWFDGNWYQVPLGLADVNVGILWLLGITSLATYGIVLAGWSSNNKYAMLGGLRASAQMISYELSLGLTMAVPVMIVGSMSLGDIINAQRNVWDWFVFQNPLAAGVLIIALFAEVSRSPFDLPEAEQELTAGFMTEYSGMKFAMFMMAEYIGMIGVGVIASALFFGGFHIIPVDGVPILGPLFMILKVVVFLAIFIWVRATLPRIRYDRLMQFGWKVLLPLALLSVAWTAVAVVIGDVSGSPIVYGVVSGIFFLLVVVGGYFFLRSSGDPVAPAEPDLADDPIITGERRGAAWVALNMVGGLVSIPFTLVSGINNALKGAEQLAQPGSDSRAIEPVTGQSVTRGSGD
ncbi:MAG: NADH-quinone oxidoreductase subunit NuoH [Anaerolineae bacterium]|jgi:NADH-quinone oxidoreductase subunit H|nr:NADH-quinone oxidoreductase subunit NuoH [Anaerolineae bacterium]